MHEKRKISAMQLQMQPILFGIGIVIKFRNNLGPPLRNASRQAIL